tara:strand:- start:1242 stop:1637 length:396 start_codon:yes stop_codon:yes gene_type:complete
MSKLKEKVQGFIYEYYRTDNKEVVYRGSSKHDDEFCLNEYKRTALENVDFWHRDGQKVKMKYKYNWTVFRSNLRRPIGNKLKIRMLHEPKTMTFEELLTLEGQCIQEKIQEGQCYLNHDPDPLKSWKKYND